jgi:signal transduction histidine kinase
MTFSDSPVLPTDHSAIAVPCRVLLVDDQALIAEALRRMLADQPNIECHYVSDARSALQTAVEFKPTVILQDLVMPEFDGFELVRQFRTHPVIRQVPIIVLSSKEEPKLKAHGFALGASDYLVKWPDKLELLARIRYHSAAYMNLVKLAQANAELERLGRMKNEFISTVSHELRTPLTSIRGSLGLLTGGAVGQFSAQAKSLLDIANKNCERLVRMVNDMLDIDKMESGNMPFELVNQSLVRLAEQAIQATQGHAQQYNVGVQLQCDMAELADIEVAVDRDRMIQVLVNLLSNAIKYSPAGTAVEVRIRREADSVRLSVADHGNGIPKEFHDRIFQKFGQVDATDSRQKGGTGLGLSICKSIVEEHRGSIDFHSEVGRGTEFYVILPLPSDAVPVRAQTTIQ